MQNEVARAEAKKPTVAILLTPQRRAEVLAEETEKQLASFCEVRRPAKATLSTADLPALLEGATACLTGWGTPLLSEEVLASCPQLRLVAHTAGSIRRLLPESAFARGLRITHAAAIIADSVAEFVIAQALLWLRRPHEIDRAMKAGQSWEDLHRAYPGSLLGSKTFGVVGTGRVGRAVIRLCKAFGCRVLVYDPYLTAEQAAQMGVESVALDDLMTRCDIVSLHAPALPETEGMIGAAQLARLRDNALFINSSRAQLVDEAALLRELRSGRIAASLDVFAYEPMPLDSPLRELSNILLTPHIAGHTLDTHLRQGQAMVDEVQRFLRGEELRYEISTAMLSIMA